MVIAILLVNIANLKKSRCSSAVNLYTNCGTAIPWNSTQQLKRRNSDACNESDESPGNYAEVGVATKGENEASVW